MYNEKIVKDEIQIRKILEKKLKKERIEQIEKNSKIQQNNKKQ